MKKIFLFFLLFSAVHAAEGQNKGNAVLEFVESIPIETNLDNPDIRNTSEVWLEMIHKARTSLDIEQFYISRQPGEPLDEILDAIGEAAQRGVKVRIIVDGRMYKTYPATVDSMGKCNNIETRKINFVKIGGGTQHSKYFIVDGKEIFVGSQNFDWRALKHIHELGLRIAHQGIAKIYQDIFNFDWQMAAGEGPKEKPQFPPQHYQAPFAVLEERNDAIYITPTMSPITCIPDSTLWDEKHIVALIDGATTSLLLQFLSYSPESRSGTYAVIDDALRRAANRGVSVKMIVSDWQKDTPAQTYLKRLSAVPHIQVKFSCIPEWSKGYVSFGRVEHCKYIIADEKAFWLGTSNCEKSYYYTSRNLGIVVKNGLYAQRLANIFIKSWGSSYTELIKETSEYEPREHGER
jgi:phosphatidylserine/phosphatidylglycerophosphate/cardiolipin synthase-like enzyme